MPSNSISNPLRSVPIFNGSNKNRDSHTLNVSFFLLSLFVLNRSKVVKSLKTPTLSTTGSWWCTFSLVFTHFSSKEILFRLNSDVAHREKWKKFKQQRHSTSFAFNGRFSTGRRVSLYHSTWPRGKTTDNQSESDLFSSFLLAISAGFLAAHREEKL